MKLDHWCIWQYDDGRKVPYQSRHPRRLAKTNDPKTWSSYTEAVKAAPQKGGGIGFMLLGSGFGALDLDDCREPKTGRIDAWAQDLIARADGAYVEVTPSGCGLRIIGVAEGEEVHTIRQMGRGKVEVYRNTPRYITITGRELRK
jgi:putative DNA primase/helicase